MIYRMESPVKLIRLLEMSPGAQQHRYHHLSSAIPTKMAVGIIHFKPVNM
jgi:hypothetical protein